MNRRRWGCGCAVLPFGLVVAGLLTLAAIGGGLPSTSAPAGSYVDSAVPAAYRQWVIQAGQLCPALPPQVLAAQIEQESNWNPRAVSPVGAQGIAQFMPGTWGQWGVDGDGDGVADVWNPADALLSAARYDCAIANVVQGYVDQGSVKGNPTDLMLAGYNAGVDKVKAYGGIPPYAETQNYVATIHQLMAKYQDLAGTVVNGGSGFGAAVVAAAQHWLGTPYSWGGGTVNGPSTGIDQGAGTVGFDCSGLVMYAVYQASGGKIRLPHLSESQVTLGTEVKISDMQPGDIIGFAPNGSDFEHIGIYVGDGKFLHAPHTGAVIKISPLTDEGSAVLSIRRFG